MAKTTTKRPIPRTVPTEREAASRLRVIVRADRAAAGTAGDAINTRLVLAGEVEKGPKALAILKGANVPQAVITYHRGSCRASSMRMAC